MFMIMMMIKATLKQKNDRLLMAFFRLVFFLVKQIVMTYQVVE